MAKCDALYTEIRFTFPEGLTHCYVLIEARGDCPLGVAGWHHKAFPATVNVVEILNGIATGDAPHLWDHGAPDG